MEAWPYAYFLDFCEGMNYINKKSDPTLDQSARPMSATMLSHMPGIGVHTNG